MNEKLEAVMVVRTILEPLKENFVGLEFHYDIFLLRFELLSVETLHKVECHRVNILLILLLIHFPNVHLQKLELVVFIKLRAEPCDVPQWGQIGR